MPEPFKTVGRLALQFSYPVDIEWTVKEENSIYFGCWNGYEGPEWGMERYKTLSDLENEHGKALHVKINWNGKTEGIQFENKWFSFNMMKSSEKKIEGINDLPVEATDEGRCKGLKKDGERCKRYSPCSIKGHRF